MYDDFASPKRRENLLVVSSWGECLVALVLACKDSLWILCRTSNGLVSTYRGYKLRKYVYVCSSNRPKNENKNNEIFYMKLIN